MRYDVALQKLQGQSVGGQLIVRHAGRHVLVGRHHDGQLIDVTEEGKKLVAGLTDDPLDHDNDGRKGGGRRKRGALPAADEIAAPAQDASEAEPVHHEVTVEDAADMTDSAGA